MLFVVHICHFLLQIVLVAGCNLSFYGFPTNGISGVHPRDYPDMVVPGNVSTYLCLSLCGQNVQCMSIFVQAGLCHLYWNGFVDNTVLLPNPGWKFYNLYTGGCPYGNGYIESRELNICYKLHIGGERNGINFRDTCASEGGELLRISSQKIQDHIAAFLADVTCYDTVSIQGSDQTTEGIFTFDDGSRMTYFNWQDPEPNNCDNEDVIFLGIDTEFKWFVGEDKVPSKTSFICGIGMA